LEKAIKHCGRSLWFLGRRVAFHLSFRCLNLIGYCWNDGDLSFGKGKANYELKIMNYEFYQKTQLKEQMSI
jgi:hypothetical protein